MARGYCLFQGQTQEAVGAAGSVEWSRCPRRTEPWWGAPGRGTQWGWGCAEERTQGCAPGYKPKGGSRGVGWGSRNQEQCQVGRVSGMILPRPHLFSGAETETKSKVLTFPSSQGVKLNERQVS